jgi:hypothetical protein
MSPGAVMLAQVSDRIFAARFKREIAGGRHFFVVLG